MSKARQWFSGKTVMKRWSVDPVELVELLMQGLPAYERQNGDIVRVEPDVDYRSEVGSSLLLFKPSDVEDFEKEHEWLGANSADVNDVHLSAKEKRELGRLQREKAKWDKSIEAAVHVGLFCAGQDDQVTRAQLVDEIYKIDPTLPKTTIDKIWKAIPEQYRKGAGAPKKK